MAHFNFGIISRISIFVLTFPIFAQSVSLDNTGSYKLVVAIDEKTAQNSVPQYVENIQIGFQQLSEALHLSTNSKFSIAEVDIVIPSHWNTPFDGVATTQHYEAADVKISHVHNLPLVDNPQSCGRAGSAILLPYNFFDDPNNSSYGDIGKALLTQFVRYRFGAWEEHGYPGDGTFNYFWKNGNDWEVNACTNDEILGEFRNIDDETDCSPKTGDEYPPPTECRFFPTPQQTATSSLMSYHYLPSITKFCDSQTHNKKIPTPQNFFCKYKSITEIIESSSDWKGTNQPNRASEVVFKIVKNSATPLLYILLDGGISQAPSLVMGEISAALKTLLDDSNIGNVVASVAKYPPDEGDQLLTEIVPWAPFNEGKEQFTNAFDTTFGRAPGFRDFGGGLKEAVYRVSERGHSGGAVILMVKTGIETNTAALTSESEVLTKVLPSKVKIFGLEIQGSDIQPGIALERVTTMSEGVHLALTSSSNYSLELGEFMETLRAEVINEIVINRGYVVAIHDVLTLAAPVRLRVASRIKTFEAFLTPLSGTITNPAFKFTSEGNAGDVNFQEMKQWGSLTSSSVKVYHHSQAVYNTPVVDRFWDEFRYTCTEGECSVLVHVFIKVEFANEIPPVTLKVSSSAENSVVDMSVENSATDLGTPFAIYARLEQNNIPLSWTAGLGVFAYIVHPENSEVYKIELKDDGRAIPDVSMNDGVYSGTFVPSLNGSHNIFVSVTYRVPQPPKVGDVKNVTLPNYMSSRSVGKLFPVDQVHSGCGSSYLGCWYEPPTVEFIASQTLSKSVEFKNVERYIPMANRIVDFLVTPMSQLQIRLEWTDPGVFMANELVKIDSYQIKHSDDFNKLLEDFDNADDLFPPNDLPTPGEPGNQQSVTVSFGQQADRYFAIKGVSFLSGQNPPSPVISRIVGANVRNIVNPTTTTTTTTMTPPTSTSTASPTTQTTPTGPTTTTEGVTTQTIPTSPRTTPPPSTTPRITEPPTTTRKPTPSPFPSSTQEPPEHWFKTKEGLITIGVFGGGMIALFALGIIVIVKLRR